MLKFGIKMFVTNYIKVEEEWQKIEAKKDFVCYNYDDLQNLLLTLIESSDEAVKFEVKKEEVED